MGWVSYRPYLLIHSVESSKNSVLPADHRAQIPSPSRRWVSLSTNGGWWFWAMGSHPDDTKTDDCNTRCGDHHVQQRFDLYHHRCNNCLHANILVTKADPIACLVVAGGVLALSLLISDEATPSTIRCSNRSVLTGESTVLVAYTNCSWVERCSWVDTPATPTSLSPKILYPTK